MALSSLPRPVIRRLVENGIARARRHGLTWKSTIAGFVTLMVFVSPNFDRDPLIAQALDDMPEPIDEFWESIWERTTDDDWARIQGCYDIDAWMH
jgi:hypothetical protein